MIMTVRDSISAARPYQSDEFVWFMVDSGACVTCATVGEFDVPVDTTKTRQLYSVQGAELKVYGEQTPAVELSDGLRGTMRVTVIDASENVLTVDELLDKSWKSVVFSKDGGSFLEHTNGKQYPFDKNWKTLVEYRSKRCDLKTLKRQEAKNSIAANSDSTTMHPDEWRREHPLLIRVHRVQRRNLLTPLDCEECPVDVSNLETGRLTCMVFRGDGGEDCLEDVWLEVGHMHAEDSCLAEDEAHTPKVNVVPLPHAPTGTERAEHNLHHATFAPWCAHGVAGQGREQPHKRVRDDRVEHLIYADFLFFNNKGEDVHVADVGEATRADRGALTTVLTAIDVDSRWPFAAVAPSKKLKTLTR